ncbi:MAG: UDP-glucose 6-dehydrogenase TuaD [Microgenomates bacterium OLB23]|nr:MAG: UDP-glucose 6-dehydrogenase TuaD [Microgenomates bacterium OLB23]
MTITLVGHGYVGLVSACVFADLGNTVYVIGRNQEKLDRLKSGDPIIYEPGLEELLKKNLSAKRLIFTTSYKEAIPSSEVVMIGVGTPPTETGEADLTSVLAVATEIGKNLGPHYTVVSCKSTVPVGTNRKIEEVISKLKSPQASFEVASCPEFLREGTALNDTFQPDRIVIGSDSQKAINVLLKLHEPLEGERVVVGLESAEIIKYASNSILSTKISFANLISFICEKTGADVEEVLQGVGLDKRIGRLFLYPGTGYGGSCFPKDVLALINTGSSFDVDMTLLKSVDTINKQAQALFAEKIITNAPGKNIGVWGLAFKPNTDDVRFAPALHVIKTLLDNGFSVTAYDPEGMDNTRAILGDAISYAQSPFDAVDSKDALVIFTDWNEFKQIDLAKVKSLLKQPYIFDGRNMYEPAKMAEAGFHYFSIGRKHT